MDFLKRAAEAMTGGRPAAEERPVVVETITPVATATVVAEPVVIEKTTTVVTPVVVATPVAVATPSVDVTIAPATLETLERAPVIKETHIPEQQEVIQPVIHREIEKTEIRHVIQPVFAEETAATQIHTKELPAEFRPEVRLGADASEKLAFGNNTTPQVISTTTAGTATTVVNQAIVHETIRPHIIEEVQPVIHRTIHEPHIINERKDIYERIVEAPVEVTETRAPIYMKEPAHAEAHVMVKETVVPVVVRETVVTTNQAL